MDGTVTKLDTSRKTEDRPLLFDLTELQRESNRRFGYTAQETLSIAQSLYEKHKLITYPRTDSRYLTADMKQLLPQLLQKIAAVYPESVPFIKQLASKKLPLDKRIINDSKVSRSPRHNRNQPHSTISAQPLNAAGKQCAEADYGSYDCGVIGQENF